MCDMEVEIVTFVVKGSAQQTVTLTLDRSKSKYEPEVLALRIFDLKLSRIHLTRIIFKIGVIY